MVTLFQIHLQSDMFVEWVDVMKRTVIRLAIMLVVSSLLYGTILLAVLPKGKYSEDISLNVDDDVLQKYTSMNVSVKDFEESNIGIEQNVKDRDLYSFKGSSNNYLKKMNGVLALAFLNNKDGNQKEYRADIKNFFPFKTLAQIEIHGENIVINYKYSFGYLFLLLEIPTAIVLMLIILGKRKKYDL